MAKIGDISNSGFTVDAGADGATLANKFTAPSTFTPNKIMINFQEAWGVGGTVYVACYSDNAGAPNAMLFSGSTTYASLFNGTKSITVSGTELTSSAVYWLVAYFYKSSGTYNIDVNSENSASNQDVLTWTEASAGSWTNTPSTSTLASDRDIAIEANDDVVTTSTTRTTSTSRTTTSTSITTTSSSTSRTTTSTTRSTSTSVTTTSSSTSTSVTTTSSSTSQTTSTSTTSTTTSSSTSTSSTTISTSTTQTISTSTTTTSTSVTTTSSSTSVTTSTTTTIISLSGGLAFGEQNPTQGETAVSWQTWDDGAGSVPTISGDSSWGKISLNLGEEGRSRVYGFGDSNNRIYTLTEDRYQAGQGTATLQIRGSTTVFAQDDATPAWVDYTTPTSQNWKYVQVREINSDMWSGLGITLFSTANTALFDSYIDDALANGFTEFRIDMPDYPNTVWLAASKAAVIRAVAKGARVIWGVSSNSFNHAEYALIAENWDDYVTAVESAATWAQDNGVFEFQIGNEEEWHCYYRCPTGSLVRVGTTVTVTTPIAHNFDGTHQVTITGAINPIFLGTFDITVTDATHFTYTTVTSGNTSSTAMAYVTTLPQATLITNLKTLATSVQSIFTNGNVSYSCAAPFISEQTDNWVAVGKGDIDLLASNIYRGDTVFGTAWQTRIDTLVSTFGGGGTYLTEFAPSSTSLDSYSADEAVQATAVQEMLDYIRASGITRAIYFYYLGDAYGARKEDGTYRQLWNTLLGE